MDRGLARIILIDSYMPGRATEVTVSGHTSINGRNGAGKTSLLRLVPIFYGEHPRHLITKTSSGRKSFASWYMPREASCLVFEYVGADDDRKMAIFRAGSGPDTYQQVLVDGRYDESLFLNVQAQKFLPSSELLPRLKERGLAHYVCKSNDEYRAILLDGTHRDQLRYSLVSRNARMGAVVPLVTHMFQRNVSFEHFAQIIQDYARNNLSLQAQYNLKSFEPNRRQLSELVEHFDAFSVLNGLHARLPELTRALGELKLHQGKRSATALAARALDDRLRGEINGLAVELSEEEKALEARGHAVDAQVSETSSQRGAVVAQLNDQEAIESQLRARKQRFDADDLPGKARDIATLPDKLATLDARRDEHQRLKADLADVEGPIQAAMSDEKSRAQQAESQYLKAVAEAERGRASERERLDGDYHKARQALDDRQQAVRQQLEDRRQQAREDKIRLQTELKHPRVDPGVVRQLEAAEVLYRSRDEEAQQTVDAYQAALEEKNQAQAHFDRVNNQYEKDRHEADKAEEELAHAGQFLAGGPGSLMQFLNESLPDWQDTLGRVIDPALLRQNRLSPALVPGAEPLVFAGVRLNVESLPAPETPEALQAAYDDAQHEHGAAERRLVQTEKELDQAAARREAANKASSTAQSAADIARRKRREAVDSLDTAKATHRDAERQARARLETDLEATKAWLGELEDEHATLLEEQAAARHELSAAHEASLTAAVNEHERALAALSEAKSQRQTDHETTMARLTAQLESAIAESGVNPDDIARLEKEIHELNARCKQLESYRVQVETYQAFLENDWPDCAVATQRAEELRAQRDEFDDQIEALRAAWTNEKRQTEQALAAQRGELQNKRTAQQILQTSAALREAAGNVGLTAPEEDLEYYCTLPAEPLIREYLEQHRLAQEDLDRLGRVVDAFVDAFQGYPGSPSHDYWLQRQADWAGTDIAVVSKAKAVEEYFEGGSHKLAQDQLLVAFNYLSTLDSYRLGLEAFENGVRKFNRDLVAHLEQDLHFDLIDRVEPKITLDLSELDFWKDLTRLAELYRTWAKSSRKQLPDRALVQAIEAYSQTIRDKRGQQEDFSSLIRFKFHLEIEGRPMTAVNAGQLEDISSNGLSAIVLILLFQGFVDLVRGKHTVTMLWPLDELGTIDATNRRVLFKMLAEHDIALLTATPDLRPADLAYFHEAYELEISNGRRRLIQMQWPGQRVAPMPPGPTTEQREPS